MRPPFVFTVSSWRSKSKCPRWMLTMPPRAKPVAKEKRHADDVGRVGLRGDDTLDDGGRERLGGDVTLLRSS